MKQNSDEHRAKAREKVKKRVEYLLSPKASPKLLTPSTRLEAAAYIGALVTQIRGKPDGLSMTDLCALLGERMPGRSSAEPFRLHRWMLKSGMTDVTKNVIASYRNRPEPLRTIATYLRLVEQLAPIAGFDVLDCQSNLLTKLNIAEGPKFASLEVPEPAQKLSQLLNEHAKVIARDLDLAHLFQRAERLQLGWNAKIGPHEVIDLAQEKSASFRAKEPVASRCWLETAAPPLPSAKVGRLAFGRLKGVFLLTADDGTLREQEGQATAYWDLHIAIGPMGPMSVGAMFLRSTSVDLQLQDHTLHLADLQDDVDQFISGYPQAPSIFWEGRHWTVSCEATTIYSVQKGAQDVAPPSGTVPNIRLEPVTPASVTSWLLAAQADDEIDLFSSLQAKPTGWIRIESLGRSVEAALRTRALDKLLINWVEEFTKRLDDFESTWRSDCEASDAALRARYQKTDLNGDLK